MTNEPPCKTILIRVSLIGIGVRWGQMGSDLLARGFGKCGRGFGGLAGIEGLVMVKARRNEIWVRGIHLKLGITNPKGPIIFFFIERFCYCRGFLGASKRFYNSLRLLVGPSVGCSVGLSVPILLLPGNTRAWFVIHFVTIRITTKGL
jgi:hypothetical protein